MVNRTQRELTDDDIARIANTYHAWRGAVGATAMRATTRVAPTTTGDDTPDKGTSVRYKKSAAWGKFHPL